MVPVPVTLVVLHLNQVGAKRMTRTSVPMLVDAYRWHILCTNQNQLNAVSTDKQSHISMIKKSKNNENKPDFDVMFSEVQEEIQEKDAEDEVIKENDHCMDAMRYFVYTVLDKRTVSTRPRPV